MYQRKMKISFYPMFFTTSAYQAEVEHFLEKQQEYHTQISPEFVKKYLEIFGRKRAYYEGPGNELSAYRLWNLYNCFG